MGDGGTALYLLCLLLRNPGRSAPCKGRGRAVGQLTCREANGRWEAGWRAWGSGPPPRGRAHGGEGTSRHCSGNLQSERSLQAGTVFYFLFSLFPSLLNSPPPPPGKKRIGKLSLVCPGAWAGSQESRRQAHLAASSPAGEEGGRGLRPDSLTFTLISGKN